MTKNKPKNWTIGILGGSGLYDIDGLTDAQWIDIDTPWGKPSDQILLAELDGIMLRFLPRHGRGHKLSPSDINYRANIDALKRAGCTDVISISAVGSLKETYAPGDFVIVDQFVDRTRTRKGSFFGKGCAAHVSMAEPVSFRLAEMAAKAAERSGINVHRGGTYLAMEGPQFSTKAESHMYRQMGFDVIGMTNMPEAKLAREAELPYATVAMITDYDCWHPDFGHVEVAKVIEVLLSNADKGRALLRALIDDMANAPRTPDPQGIETCLDSAIVTAPDARGPKRLAKLDAVAGRVLGLK